MDQYVELRKQAIQAGSGQLEDPEANMTHTMLVYVSIGKLIRYNRRI